MDELPVYMTKNDLVSPLSKLNRHPESFLPPSSVLLHLK